MHARTERTGASGQILVIMAFIFIVVLAIAGLVVDGGNAWSQQRIVQNGSDAAAEAGAVVFGERLAGATTPAGGWDAAINTKIQANATTNGIAISAAYYTDICGIPLQTTGDAALNADGSYNFAVAAKVGAGTFPTVNSTTPDCPSMRVGPPAGVLVVGAKTVNTYFAGIVGLNTLNVTTQATAVSGYLQGMCDASLGQACALLPVTIPVNVATCDGSNNLVTTGTPWIMGQLYKVPLCGNSPGNVGWLDWTPPSGGSSELVCSILHPNNPAIVLPSWQFVTSTGNVNGGGGQCNMSVEAAIRTYDGEVVMIPQFDATCGVQGNGPPPVSTDPAINTGPNFGCPNPINTSSHGQDNYYRMPSFAFFQLCSGTDADCVAASTTYGAYIQGNNSICDTGNGATSCLVGKFVSIMGSGTVGPGVGGGTGGNKAIGIQLIK